MLFTKETGKNSNNISMKGLEKEKILSQKWGNNNG